MRDALQSLLPRRVVLEWVDTCEQALAEMELGHYDICLLDYRLGASTGLELLAQARGKGWQGPAILLTGAADDEVDYRAMEAGAADFLTKSQLTPELLERSIRYTLQHARMLEALRRSQASFRELIERLPDGICVLQGEQLVYANPALVRLVGWDSPNELVGRSVRELEESLFHPDDQARLTLEFREAQREGRPVPPCELRLLRKEGDIVPVEIAQLSVVFDGQPSLVRIVRNLTERKQMQARLMLSDRMASLGTLAAGIAHEINNPLSYVMTNLSHLEADVLPRLVASGGDQEEIRKLVSDAQVGLVRVRDIVRQLKMFSRAEEQARPEPVDVQRVLEGSIRMAWNELRHRARLVRDYSEPLLAEADEGRLGQVVLNLLVNAAHAIPEGSVERNEIRVVTRRHPGGVAIEVRDTGSGIPANLLEKVFEPFFTTKPVGVGTGLGLSICREIVTSVGGRMEVESTVGRGSTFRLILRAATAPLQAQRAPQEQVHEAPARGRILVVDDEPMIGMAVRRSLQRHHEVVTLTSAREALVRLQGGEHFDLILSDLMMPEMSGMDLHLELSYRLPELAERMVFMTGGAFTPDARAFMERIGNSRLEKPFSTQELQELVRTRLRGAGREGR
ncbi:ATP-binding response regulator [Archangium violaceum]|uniref:ATP-binding response regulator n=1 Tax=Archangium violaceum TaxID=83451 RepID=UPI001EF6A833|nr:response regulator [Archangium violaceum]